MPSEDNVHLVFSFRLESKLGSCRVVVTADEGKEKLKFRVSLEYRNLGEIYAGRMRSKRLDD